MFFHGINFIVFSCLIFCIDISKSESKCPEASDIQPCHCYMPHRQIRCENITELLNLTKIGSSIEGDWNILYIHKTKLDKIEKNTFSNATFNRILIDENDDLLEIHEESFKNGTTEELEIRDNTNLEESGLFKIAHQFGETLRIISFDKNKIKSISEPFNGENNLFQRVEYIRLDGQNGKTDNDSLIEIINGTFSNLPELKQLSLDNNNIKKLGAKAIDLSNSKPGNPKHHISIFLNNNKLDENQINSANIVLPPNGTQVSVGLVLENNKIITFNNNDLFFGHS